jgi:diguanylate cyclase (GGDEF)-like protein
VERVNPFLRQAWLIAGFVLAYAAACVFAGAIVGPSQVALYWPASGLAFAVVVVGGLRWALLVPFALLLQAPFTTPTSGAFLAMSMASNTLALLAGGWLARRRMGLRPGSVLYAVWMMAGGLLTSFVSGVLGGYSLWLEGMAGGDGLAAAQLLWGMGDFLGIASVSPALMIGAARWQKGQLRSSRPDLLGERTLWNMALATSFLAMAWGMNVARQFSLGLAALPLAVMLWSAVRFTPMRTSVSALLTVGFVAVLAGLGLAGFPRPPGTFETAILIGYLSLLAMLPQVLALAIDEHRWLQRRLERRANTEPLTGLPNRAAFEREAAAFLDDAAGGSLALAYIDLDNLKLVNDTASHRAGDALIVAVAAALATRIGADDRFAHLGADEFAVLMGNTGAGAARERALGLLRAVESVRCRYGGEEFTTTASIGLAIAQAGHVEFDELLSQADAACFAAKELGGDRVRTAGAGSNALADPVSGMRWTVRIRDALNHGGLLLYAQSIVPLQLDPEPGARFELLLRMRDDRGGPPLTPERFIAAAERFRLGVRIDREVLRMALAQLDANPEASAGVALCTLNLSAGALMDDGFVDYAGECLHRAKFPASRLCFEITETGAMRDPARAQRAIDELRALGCRFALDDFGTGFCSFSHLRALDVDYIKIDGSFVHDMDRSGLSAEVVRSITRIAHLLRKRTIAEHTESEAIREALTAFGVDYAQGYAIDHPQPLPAYLAALARGTTTAA